MHQQSWTYSGQAKIHQIDLIHVFESKEVAICLNGVVLFREQFLEIQPKTFSFFIDGNFCEIRIHKENGEYFYQFMPHPYSTSKVGQQHKFRERLKNWGIGMAMLVVIFGLFLPFSYYLFQRHQNAIDLSLGGVLTTAIITQIDTKSHQNKTKTKVKKTDIPPTAKVHYKFLVNSRWQYSQLSLPLHETGQIFTAGGLPIHRGDEFELLFSSVNFRVHQINLKQPTDQQIRNYQKQALQSCLAQPQTIWTPAQHWRYCDCWTTYVYQYYALDGLLAIIHQNASPTQNPYFNQQTYQQFLSQEQAQGLEKWCVEEL